jgi:predicted MFS family arabinose efflux permease
MTKQQENIILLLLAAINFTHIIDFMIMMPLGPQLMRYFDITPQAFSYLVSAYTISAGISGFLMAFFVDRFNRKSVLLLGYIGFVVGTIDVYAHFSGLFWWIDWGASVVYRGRYSAI